MSAYDEFIIVSDITMTLNLVRVSHIVQVTAEKVPADEEEPLPNGSYHPRCTIVMQGPQTFYYVYCYNTFAEVAQKLAAVTKTDHADALDALNIS